MPREIKSASEIHAEVMRIVNSNKDVQANGFPFRIAAFALALPLCALAREPELVSEETIILNAPEKCTQVWTAAKTVVPKEAHVRVLASGAISVEPSPSADDPKGLGLLDLRFGENWVAWAPNVTIEVGQGESVQFRIRCDAQHKLTGAYQVKVWLIYD